MPQLLLDDQGQAMSLFAATHRIPAQVNLRKLAGPTEFLTPVDKLVVGERLLLTERRARQAGCCPVGQGLLLEMMQPDAGHTDFSSG